MSSTAVVARWVNSDTASYWGRPCRDGSRSGSGTVSGGTRSVASPSIARGSRLVARMRRFGLCCSSAAARSATASITCSQLSKINNSSREDRKSSRISCSDRSFGPAHRALRPPRRSIETECGPRRARRAMLRRRTRGGYSLQVEVRDVFSRLRRFRPMSAGVTTPANSSLRRFRACVRRSWTIPGAGSLPHDGKGSANPPMRYRFWFRCGTRMERHVVRG